MATLRTSRPVEEVRVDRGDVPDAAARGWATSLVVAAITFWLAFDSGTYSLTSRTGAAIVVWWVIVLAAAVLGATLRPVGGPAMITGLALAGFAAWTLASTQWAPNAADALSEFDRVALALGVFLIAVIWSTRRRLTRVTDGIAIGIASVAILALLSRFFPTAVASGSALAFLQVAGARLSYPLGYWNGLGALLAVGAPLVLRAAVSNERTAVRSTALALLPTFAGAIYLTSSRGAALEVAVALFVFFLLSPRRAQTAVALAAATLATLPLALYFRQASSLVDGPLGGHAATHEGAVAAAILIVSSVLLGLAYAWALGSTPFRRLSAQRLERPLLIAALVIACAGTIASHPIKRVHDFRYAPVAGGVSQHFLNGSGNGRWQMWSIAMREYRHHPVLGSGAGTYVTWWTQYRTSSTFVQNAHSLYVETLGELGPIGLLLVLGFVLTPLVVGIRRRLQARGEHALTLACMVGGFAAYAVAAGLDWVWQIPGVTLPAIVLLALLVSGSSAVARDVETPRRSLPTALRAAAVVGGLAIVAAQAIPLLAQVQLEASQAAARRGDGKTALKHARSAESIESWSPAPYEQVALLDEQLGNLTGASSAIDDALSRDHRSWQLWLTKARLQTKSGEIDAAATTLERAKRLNPVWAAQLAKAARAEQAGG